ncbi:MAG TPA: hypothetical protein GXX29_07425 [Firmicutes bacterium]|nr:hypothetical protein [Bacillota bacterium]
MENGLEKGNEQKDLVLTVEAGAHDRFWEPVTAIVDEEAVGAIPCCCCSGMQAVMENGLKCPVQVERLEGKLALTWLVPSLKAGHTLDFTITPDCSCEGESGVELAERGDGDATVIDIKVNGEHFTSYHYGANLPRPFLYPVYLSPGVAVTRHFPMRDDVEGEPHDHRHHRSIWFTHGDVNGHDNWSENPGHAVTRHNSFTKMESGPVFGTLASDNTWYSVDGKPLLNHKLEMKVYALPSGIRLADFQQEFSADFGDIVFGDTKEGGLLSVRVAGTMQENKGGQIQLASGACSEKEAWGQPAPWCHYTGLVYGPNGPVATGIAIMDHPENPRHPSHWHVRAYGLMTANPFGHSHFYRNKERNGSMTLPAGKKVVFRYRLLIHDGEPGHLQGMYPGWAFPAKVSVK